MSVLVVGMSHQSAPVALLEKLSMDSAVQDSACGQLVAAEPLTARDAKLVGHCHEGEDDRDEGSHADKRDEQGHGGRVEELHGHSFLQV